MSKRDTQLVIEDDTVYEVDLACLRNRKRRKPPQQKKEKQGKKKS